LLVPETGEWTFTLGSDDCSWLWIDDALVIDNAKVAPHRRKSGKVTLAAGSHRVRIVFTEIGGQESLEFLWRAPSGAEEIVPANALARSAVTLTPRNVSVSNADVGDLVRIRGKDAYAARRCAACHTIDAGDDAPRAPVAKPWSHLQARACAVDPRGEATFVHAGEALSSPVTSSVALAASLESLQCTSCHARDGKGGIHDDARQRLAEVEDLGDEGRVPPDLSRAGYRLRRAWVELLLQGENRIRGYMKARMPKLSPALAQRIAEQFERADAKPLDDQEPSFDATLVAHGQQLVGVAGRNCVTCHPFGGRKAIGPQGMDLALQAQRLKPAWFAEWLLHATKLRPGTRMPSFWLADDASSRRDVDAIRVWSSLGDAAPVPKGYRSEAAGLLLDPIDRPILHGAFLKGLSARCVAVGSPLRGHYAYDVEHARLAWLWRGDFLDAAGTWSGRAGQLLEPSSKDRVALDALLVRDVAGSKDATPLSIGQRRTKDGYPTFRVRVGEAEFEDATVPEFTSSGIAFVRTIRCEKGRIRIEASPTSGSAKVTIDGAPAGVREQGQGESVALRYDF
jgi:mono/diheme cytochrome c family protein